MEDIYVPLKRAVNCLVRNDRIGKMIKGEGVRLLLDVTDKDFDIMTNAANVNDDERNDEFSMMSSFMQDLDLDAFPAKDFVEKIEERGGKGLSRAIVVADRKEETYDIEKKYAVKVVSDKASIGQLQEKSEFFFDEGELVEAERPIDWSRVISNEVTLMPCNTLIMVDRYLNKNKCDNDKNVQQIVELLTRNVSSLLDIHLLIIFSQDNQDKQDKAQFEDITNGWADKIQEVLKRNDIKNAVVEFIQCDRNYKGKYDLYKYTHQRFVITNYAFIKADHNLNAFDDRKGSVMQTINYGNILGGANLKAMNAYVRHCAEEIKKGYEKAEDSNTPYLYAKYEITDGKREKTSNNMKDITNRMIVDEIGIKEGEKCHYLSVENDWANIKILPGFYHVVGFEKRIYAKKEEDLEDIQKKIQELFENHSYEIPVNESERSYRVSVTDSSNIKTVHVIPNTTEEKDYPRNLFKNRNDAISMADKVAEFCGFKRTVSDE